ncbi:hypothetical protein BDK51DRAFT_32465 [Blyttiomyces helicus]|uniref:GRAM domain-containing protein n=1 Tax=Blyttiomyces helicus TaxID=388810 RepID=A0A4P9W035_9FUNG|nr:hypothetical protein BDK51DRAFT_32465 [Blyttiomyces helicus]|eukprot:RKO85481.1 hypothetical protein BDK51DRAFT_32465 [Blyttiomyces helicus]
MSLNGAVLLSPDNSPALIQGEKSFLVQAGVRMEFDSANPYPGRQGYSFTAVGTLHLTNIRVIYVPRILQETMKNINIPLENLRDGKLYQPWFDANRYEANVIPVPNGGLSQPGRIKWAFKEGGGFEFSSIFMQLRSRITGESLPQEEPLPLYDPSNAPPPANAGSSSSTPTPALPFPLPPAFSESGLDTLVAAPDAAPVDDEPRPDAPPGYQ